LRPPRNPPLLMRAFRFLKEPLNVISTLLLVGALLLQFIVPLSAEETSAVPDPLSAVEESTDEEELSCLETIAEPMALLTEDIVEFLNTHYLSQDLNSTLIEGAYAKYDEYRYRLKDLLVQQFRRASEDYTQTFDRIIDEDNRCVDVVADQIKTVKTLLTNHNIQSAGAKKSYGLVTKLKEVNEKMRGLNRSFGEMYGGFKAFADKIQNTVE
jgi:hypothetical protein